MGVAPRVADAGVLDALPTPISVFEILLLHAIYPRLCSERTHTMTTIDPEAVSLVSLRNSLGEIVNEVAYGNHRRIISKNGKQVAALIPIAELELLDKLEEEADLAALKEARAEDNGERLSLEDFLEGKRI
jgi:prevent-host-death family protein